MRKLLLCLCTAPILFVGCGTRISNQNELISIQITDQNGLSETISTEEKLKTFQTVDFSSRQPYKRVLRVYKKDKEGKSHNVLTTYHQNGHIDEELHCIGTAAQGGYKKWHPSGKLHIEATVVGGPADVSPLAKKNWLFDGISNVYDDKETLVAKINYENGLLEGTSLYFNSDSSLKEKVSFKRGNIEGKRELYQKTGIVYQEELYSNGVQEGKGEGFFANKKKAYTENYSDGKLILGYYFSKEGTLLSKIIEGKGEKAVFHKDFLEKMISYENGLPEGQVNIFSEEGELVQSFVQKENKKTGLEIIYFSTNEAIAPLTKKLSIEWDNDTVHGTVKTYYPNGKQESQKEFSRNQKSGMSFSWYENGDLMLLEEYEKNILTKGSYYEKSCSDPISKVEKGTGLATLYDKDGTFVRKIRYKKGEPEE